MRREDGGRETKGRKIRGKGKLSRLNKGKKEERRFEEKKKRET